MTKANTQTVNQARGRTGAADAPADTADDPSRRQAGQVTALRSQTSVTGTAAGPSPVLSQPGRRQLLKVGGVGLLAGLGWSGSRRATAQEAVQLNFAFGPDDSGSLRQLVDDFNTENEGRIQVNWREMSRSSDDYRRQLVSDFEVRARDVDVFGADVVWTAEFADQGWCADLSDRFRADFRAGDFLTAPLRSARYRDRIYGVPWFTDAGMLYYRRDLLRESGFSEPPTTWQELASMAQKVREEHDIEHGLVFQGADYEGGVTNALEFIWNAGGRVLTGNVSVTGAFGMNAIDPNVITVNNPNAAAGLDAARQFISDGIAPEAVVEFRELESQQAFLDGQAVFMRNWPFVFGLLQDDSGALQADQVGVAALPRRGNQSRSYSCLGGWNLMISAYSEKQQAAWEFIVYASAAKQQTQRARQGGFLPTLAARYDDQDLLQDVPVMKLGAQAIDNARVRPESPYYADISPRIATAWNRVLRGEFSGDEAVRRLQRELERILRFNR